MSLITLKGVVSTSAPNKAQKDAAVYLFGSKGHSIVAVLDKFSRAKELFSPHIDGLLKLMKEGEDDEIIKFASSSAGKKSIAAAKAFATAKTLGAAIKALKLIRVPAKWIAGHSDAAAARIQETTTIRARKSSAGKPEKPIKMDNPGAPESVQHHTKSEIDALSKVYVWNKFDPKTASSWAALSKAFNELFKGRFVSKFSRAEGALRVDIKVPGYQSIPAFHIGVAPEEKSWFMYALSPTDDGVDGRLTGPKLTLASVLSVMTDLMAQNKSPAIAANKGEIAGAVVYDEDRPSINPESVKFNKKMAKIHKEANSPKAINTIAKITGRNISKVTTAMGNMISTEMTGLLGSAGIGNCSFHDDTPYDHLPEYVFDAFLTGEHKNLAGAAILPPQKGSANWRIAGQLMGRKEITEIYDLGPKLTAAKVKSALSKIKKDAVKK